MRYFCFIVILVGVLAAPVLAGAHFDIAPFFQGGRLLTGGRDHVGTSYAPIINVYGYDFGEDAADPFNPADPGVNQSAGVGSLIAGAPVRFNILDSLRYWDGAGGVNWTTPPGGSYMTLLMGTGLFTLTGSSGPHAGGLIQSVLADGSVHKHFTSSLYAQAGASNIPGDAGYVAPPGGIYATSFELTMTDGSTTYTSNPFWVVFNNGMSETIHDAAMQSLPEPSAGFLLFVAAGLLVRRHRKVMA